MTEPDVCSGLLQTVFHRGQAFVPGAYAAENPADIPAVLGAWVQALGALQQAQDIQGALVQLLQSRVGCGQQQPAAVSALELPAMLPAQLLLSICLWHSCPATFMHTLQP